MRVLIGCERSGVVRDAFLARGHDAISCDLAPSTSPGPHIIGDVIALAGQKWDLVILHPPCQYLSDAAAGLMHDGHHGPAINPDRWHERLKALRFFMSCYFWPCPRVAVENPPGYTARAFIKPTQIIHPWQFGDCHMKRTALWLRGLPLLIPQSPLQLFPQPLSRKPDGRPRYFTDAGSGSAVRRSRTFEGIAAAMAAQWSAPDARPLPVHG